MTGSVGSLIHIYNTPPQAGDEALCGHVKIEEESYRLHRSDNQCEVCNAIASAEGRTLVSRSPLIENPDVWVSTKGANMSTTQPNAYCIIHGTPGKDPLTIEGPFATQEEAQTNADADQKAAPNVPVTVDILVNPANC